MSCLLTSASLHDSQAASPLAQLTAGRVAGVYDLMDSANDADEIRACSLQLGRVPLIDSNPWLDALKNAELQRSVGQVTAQTVRYRERSTVEWSASTGVSRTSSEGNTCACADTPRCSAT